MVKKGEPLAQLLKSFNHKVNVVEHLGCSLCIWNGREKFVKKIAYLGFYAIPLTLCRHINILNNRAKFFVAKPHVIRLDDKLANLVLDVLYGDCQTKLRGVNVNLVGLKFF